MAQKSSSKSSAHRLTKKQATAILIAIVAVILVIAITACVLYFGFPQTWDSLMSRLFGKRLEKGDGTLEVHFLDVGQGDCIYISFPDGTDMLIDGGNKSTGFDFATSVKPYLKNLNPDGEIDRLMLTHSDEDHVDFLDEIIYEYQIYDIYIPNILASPTNADLQAQVAALDDAKLAMFTDEDVVTTRVYAEFFVAALSEPSCNIHLNMDDDEHTNNIVISDSANTYCLTFYCPTKEYYQSSSLVGGPRVNAVSPVGVLEYNGRGIVLTGDSNSINEPIVARRLGQRNYDVLKVAHHGSESSSLDEFLSAVKCEYAVISCNANGNTYHHPRQEALDRLVAHGMTIYRTDNNGTVVLSVDKNGDMHFQLEKEATQQQNRIGAA